MTTYEYALVIGGGLGGFLFGMLTFFTGYYILIRNSFDFKDKLSVGIFVMVGFSSLFQGVLLTALLTGPR